MCKKEIKEKAVKTFLMSKSEKEIASLEERFKEEGKSLEESLFNYVECIFDLHEVYGNLLDEYSYY